MNTIYFVCCSSGDFCELLGHPGTSWEDYPYKSFFETAAEAQEAVSDLDAASCGPHRVASFVRVAYS